MPFLRRIISSEFLYRDQQCVANTSIYKIKLVSVLHQLTIRRPQNISSCRIRVFLFAAYVFSVVVTRK